MVKAVGGRRARGCDRGSFMLQKSAGVMPAFECSKLASRSRASSRGDRDGRRGERWRDSEAMLRHRGRVNPSGFSRRKALRVVKASDLHGELVGSGLGQVESACLPGCVWKGRRRGVRGSVGRGIRDGRERRSGSEPARRSEVVDREASTSPMKVGSCTRRGCSFLKTDKGRG